jgi:putative ATPase
MDRSCDDEIHRYKKAQQDALLQVVEDATVTLIGATTENPSFEVISALLSRTKVLTLQPLSKREIATILRRALTDPDRGLSSFRPEISSDELERLASSSAGDARVALAALESAVHATIPSSDGVRRIDGEMLIQALGRARFAYDKNGEDYFSLISAFMKRLRHSDANAALYWLARLIEEGADPLFIARRLCILASPGISGATSCQRHYRTGTSFTSEILPELTVTKAKAICFASPPSPEMGAIAPVPRISTKSGPFSPGEWLESLPGSTRGY